MASSTNVLAQTEAQKLFYKLVGKNQPFSTKRRIDFVEDLNNLFDRYDNGNILMDYPNTNESDNFEIFIKSVSMLCNLDWKQLYSPNDQSDPIRGWVRIDDEAAVNGVYTQIKDDAVDLQTFIRKHDLGTVTLTADSSAYIIDWTKKVSFTDALPTNNWQIRKWIRQIGLDDGWTYSVGDVTTIERNSIKIDTTYWIDITFDSTEAKYPIYGDEANDLLIGRLWCEGAQGFIALYFANYDAIKFRIRRHGPYLKVKFWHGATGQQIFKNTFNKSIVDLIIEGRILKAD